MGKLWYLTIKYDMTLDGDPLKVDYDDNDDVTALKDKVKGKKPNDCKNVDADHLTVWQCKEPKLLTDIKAKKLENIDLSDRREAVQLASIKMVGSLELSKNEIILVQMPGKCPHSSCNFTILTYQ